ncbi:hypothetical protein [Psychrobacter jeotgali]|uniref:hypothetical protein n=1 Tax=Psychrobacter jeotgali TaxID=179010 RepID=UPI00191AB1D4|nr:hypothetical protein [Psychrobacter jeotgali]
MAVSPSTTRQASKSYRRQALIWLMMTLILGVITALLWMFVQTPAIGTKIENAPIATPNVTVQELKQPLSIEALHELDTDVQPINFEDTVRDLRSYPDEFKDKRYLLANKGKWTVQVMNVAENDVIVSYLEGRKDRNKFSYFRYRDEDNQLRYMLTYGLMSSPQEAVGAAKLVDFGLPSDVRVIPEEINRYVSIIDNYERPEPLKDLSTKRSRSVKLQPTKREVPVRQETTPAAENAESDTDKSPARNGSDSSINTNESIRQSADTSATLSVNEERTVGVEGGQPSDSVKKEDKAAEASKPPVVAAPKPPSSNNGSSANANKNSANANNSAGSNSNSETNANKGNNDSIKELIEEKTN